MAGTERTVEERSKVVPMEVRATAPGPPLGGPELVGSKAKETGDQEACAGGSGSGDRAAELMARLRLTAAEATAVILDDEEEESDLVDPARALVGKVLAPSVLHIQTISSAMRPAWGNPKGLIFNPVGDNMFLAEFGSGIDRDRVLDREPWMVGKHAVLLKKYDANFKPLQVRFDRLAIWARINDFPYRLMNSRRGEEIAKPLGRVLKVECDEQGRCWGGFMRVRVELKVEEPIPRYVTVFSSRDKSLEWFEVKYERLPLYCFSCGMLGHSFLVCSTPAERDEDGELPYVAKRLCVMEEQPKKTTSGKSGNASTSTGANFPGFDSKGSTGGSTRPTASKSRGKKEASARSTEGGTEVTSPMKSQGRGRGGGRGGNKSTRGRARGRASRSGRELFPYEDALVTVSGQKRKSGKEVGQSEPLVETPAAAPCLMLIPASKQGVVSAGAVGDDMDGDSDSKKKQRVLQPRSAGQAEAAGQPREMQ